jgi:structural maintenance of chromosome 4
VKRLTKGIEESKKDREKLSAETEKMMSMFKEIEKKAFVVQEEYKKTQEVYVLSHCTSGCPPPPKSICTF